MLARPSLRIRLRRCGSSGFLAGPGGLFIDCTGTDALAFGGDLQQLGRCIVLPAVALRRIVDRLTEIVERLAKAWT